MFSGRWKTQETADWGPSPQVGPLDRSQPYGRGTQNSSRIILREQHCNTFVSEHRDFEPRNPRASPTKTMKNIARAMLGVAVFLLFLL